jgi:hypothetical protein
MRGRKRPGFALLLQATKFARETRKPRRCAFAVESRTKGITEKRFVRLLDQLNIMPMDDYRDTPMPGRLFHPGYRAGFLFGALTLRPGMAAAEIVAAQMPA